MSKSEKDKRWQLLNIPEQELLNLESSIIFHSDVPSKVTDRFNMVKKLIQLSLYEYELLDVALERSLNSLELAIRMKNKINKEDISWSENIKELKEKNIIDGEDYKYLDKLRNLRNMLVGHPSSNVIAGKMNFKVIENIITLINKLYEPEIEDNKN